MTSRKGVIIADAVLIAIVVGAILYFLIIGQAIASLAVAMFSLMFLPVICYSIVLVRDTNRPYGSDRRVPKADYEAELECPYCHTKESYELRRGQTKTYCVNCLKEIRFANPSAVP